MARSFGAESLGADGFAVRGPVSAAPAVGCALVELGSNQLGWTSAPVALNSDLSLKANRSGDTFTGDVAINRLWTSNPIGATHAFTISRQVSGAAAFTDNTPLMKMEHIANVAYPYAGFVINHNTTVPGANPGGSYLSLGGPTNSFGLQFDYLANVGTPNYQGDVRYMLTGAQSKHIFQVNTGVTPTEVGRFDANGLTAGAIRSGGVGIKLGGTADIEFAPTNVDAATDALIIRNTTGQIDVRGNSGLRIRNLANNAEASIIAGQYVFGASSNADIAFDPSWGLQLQATSGQSYLVVRRNGLGISTGPISIGPADPRGTDDTRLVRNAAGQLDVRADNGLRLRNLANGADAALTASFGTFSTGILANGVTGNNVVAQFNDNGSRVCHLIANNSVRRVAFMRDRGDNNATGITITFPVSTPGTPQIHAANNSLASAAAVIFGDNGAATTLSGSNITVTGNTIFAGNITANTVATSAISFASGGIRVASFGSNQAGSITILGANNNGVLKADFNQTILGWGYNGGERVYFDYPVNVGGSALPTSNFRVTGTSEFTGNITQGSQDARWTIPAVGQRNSQVGNGAGVWQTGYREAYNVAGVQCGFFGVTPVAQQSIAAAATDPATTQALANSLRTAMLNLGLGV